MAADDLGTRRMPRTPYRLVAARLTVPTAGVEATIQLLQRFAMLESCAFWYGPRDGAGNGRVTAVVAPRQTMRWGNYAVAPDAMSEMASFVEDTDWKPLAQVHSHPGRNVEHSPYDDRMISSRRALSLVFPYHGQWLGRWPEGIGVHEWQDDYWHLLTEEQTCRRVVVGAVGSVRTADFRP